MCLVQVKAVEPGAVVVNQGKSDEDKQVSFGTCIWTTGNRIHPLAEAMAQQLQGQSPDSRCFDDLLEAASSRQTTKAMADCLLKCLLTFPEESQVSVKIQPIGSAGCAIGIIRCRTRAARW